MVWNKQISFISLLEVTAEIIHHHYNPHAIAFPTIYNITGLSSTNSKLYLFESFITSEKSMTFRSVS